MSEGPLISCSWFYDAQFHSPEGFARGVCERRQKSFIKYSKGPFIKMLRRNTPYGNIIYMLRLLENDRKTSFLTDLFSRSRYMKRVQLFNGRYTKGVSFVKNSIFKGTGPRGEASPNKALLSSLPPFSLGLFTSCWPTFWQLVVFRATFFSFQATFSIISEQFLLLVFFQFWDICTVF